MACESVQRDFFHRFLQGVFTEGMFKGFDRKRWVFNLCQSKRPTVQPAVKGEDSSLGLCKWQMLNGGLEKGGEGMSKFDAERLTHQQLLGCAQAYLNYHAPLDGECHVLKTQSRLDAARVPEPDEPKMTVDDLAKAVCDWAEDSTAMSQAACSELIEFLKDRKAVDG